jgi:glycosyltransferase involved in cell wall biosynthesis
MACGIPVVVSRQAGVSEIIANGVDALILEDATDTNHLAYLINRLVSEPGFRKQLASNGEKAARNYTWEKNAELLFSIFEKAHAERDES